MTSLGQTAYEAYSESAHGQSLVTGAKLPPWLELPAGIIDAWEAAANAVYRRSPIYADAEAALRSQDVVDG